MKSRTFYTTRLVNTYVNWDGELQLHCDDDSQIDAKLDVALLKRLHTQIGDRLQRLEDEQLKSLREKLQEEKND